MSPIISRRRNRPVKENLRIVLSGKESVVENSELCRHESLLPTPQWLVEELFDGQWRVCVGWLSLYAIHSELTSMDRHISILAAHRTLDIDAKRLRRSEGESDHS